MNIRTKQISEHKWKRIWENTKPEHRSYKFDPVQKTYTVSCLGDYFRYKRVWNIDESNPDKTYQCSRIDYTGCKNLFDMLWRKA